MTRPRSFFTVLLSALLLNQCIIITDDLGDLDLDGIWTAANVYLSDSCGLGPTLALALLPGQVTVEQNGEELFVRGPDDFVLSGTIESNGGEEEIHLTGHVRRVDPRTGCIEEIDLRFEGLLTETEIRGRLEVEITYDRRTCGNRPGCSVDFRIVLRRRG